MDLTIEEKQLAARIGFNENILLLVKRFATTRPIGGEKITNLNGTVTGVILARLPDFEAERGYYHQRDNLSLLRQHLYPLGYRLASVLSENILVVLKTDNQYDLLTVMETHDNFAAFFGKDLIPHLQEWDARYDLDIEQIAKNWLYMRLHRPPSDPELLAKEIYNICPYGVYNGFALRFRTEYEQNEEALLRGGYNPADFEGLTMTEKAIRLLGKEIQEQGCIGLLWPQSNL